MHSALCFLVFFALVLLLQTLFISLNYSGEELFLTLSPCQEFSGDRRVIKKSILYHNILGLEENVGITSNLSGLEA